MVSKIEQIKRFFIGTIVGIASMLPGVSGGVIAVCFGIYERLVADLADLRHRIKTDFYFLLVIGLGILFGMFVIAFGLEYLMDTYMVIALFFFVGLIIGQMPELWKLTKPKTQKFDSYNILAVIVGFLIMVAILFMGVANDVVLGHDLSSYISLIFVGIIIAVSKLAPGISGSTIILALGLYHPLMKAITDLDWALIIPLMLGLIVGLLAFAKFINYALNSHKTSTYCMIIGLTIGSILVIFDYAYQDISSYLDVIGGIVSLLLGIGLSLLFVRIGKMSGMECTT
jgi:putative membrane protein